MRFTLFAFVLIFFAFNVMPASAQAENVGEGLIVTLDMSVDLLNHTQRTFGASHIRGANFQDHSVTNWLISNWDFAKDARAAIEYNGNRIGGRFVMVPQIAGGNWGFGARLNGWAQWGPARITIGNDIETNYANWQGSDEGLLIYIGNSFPAGGWNPRFHNPDNITESSGLLVEGFFNNLTVALAAGDFLQIWDPTSRITGANDANLYLNRFSTTFRYGARVGYKVSDMLSTNASYVINYRSNANAFHPPGGDSLELNPTSADAEMQNHSFGLYGSFSFEGGGITAAYLGNMDVYLKEFFNTQASPSRMVETAFPLVFRNGIALNAHWNVPLGFTLRTENSFTFWRDKDYSVFQTGRQWNQNLEAKEHAQDIALVNNLGLRTGFGVSYFVTESMEATLFLQNILVRASASGETPVGPNMEYLIFRNFARAEVGLTYHFNANARVFVKLDFSETRISRSSEINRATTPGWFVPSVNNRIPEPVETVDTAFVVRVPVGLVLRIR